MEQSAVATIVGEFAAFPYDSVAQIDTARLDDAHLEHVLCGGDRNDLYWRSRVFGALHIAACSRAKAACVFEKVPLLNVRGSIIGSSHQQHQDSGGKCRALPGQSRGKVDLLSTFGGLWTPATAARARVMMLQTCLSHSYHLSRDKCVVARVLEDGHTIALQVNDAVVCSGAGEALAPPFYYAATGRPARSLSGRQGKYTAYCYLPSVSDILVRQLCANMQRHLAVWFAGDRIRDDALEPFTWHDGPATKPSFLRAYERRRRLRGMHRIARMFDDLMALWVNTTSPFVGGAAAPMPPPNQMPWYRYERRGDMGPQMQRLVEEYLSDSTALWREKTGGACFRTFIETVASWHIFDDDIGRANRLLSSLREDITARMLRSVDHGHVPLFGPEHVFRAVCDIIYGAAPSPSADTKGIFLSNLYMKAVMELCLHHDHMHETKGDGQPKRRGQFLVWKIPRHFHDKIVVRNVHGLGMPVFDDSGRIKVDDGILSLYRAATSTKKKRVTFNLAVDFGDVDDDFEWDTDTEMKALPEEEMKRLVDDDDGGGDDDDAWGKSLLTKEEIDSVLAGNEFW